MDKLSYALGLNIGHQLKEMGLRDRLAVTDYATAIDDVLKGTTPKISMEESTNLLNDFFTLLRFLAHVLYFFCMKINSYNSINTSNC